MELTEKQLKNSKVPEQLRPHWFKKGQSGNPKGRPKKEAMLTPLLEKMIKQLCPDGLDPKNQMMQLFGKKLTWKERVVFATLFGAIKGNPACLQEIWNRLDGKSGLNVDISGSMHVGGTIELTQEQDNKLTEEAFASVISRRNVLVDAN